MPKLKIAPLLILLPLLSLSAFAQYDTLSIVQVQGRLVEQLTGQMTGIPHVSLKITGIGVYKTNEHGEFAFKVPILDYNRFDAQVEVEIKADNYQILRPLDGILLLDTADFNITLELLAIGKEASEAYRDQIQNLNQRLSKLKREKILSLRRLSAMNDSLLNNIQRNETQRIQLENSIADLEANLQTATAGNEALRARLEATQGELNTLQTSVERLNEQLADALEEKYLRQQQFFKAISADLQDFLIRTKDVHEVIQNVKEYFPSSNNPDFVRTYDKTLQAYNDILVKINEEHENYIQGVQRYWKAPQTTQQVKNTFEVIFDQLHYPKLQPAVSEINAYIRANKKKKAAKVGHETFHRLNALIINLEKMIDKTLAALRAIE